MSKIFNEGGYRVMRQDKRTPGIKKYNPMSGDPRPPGQLKLTTGRNGENFVTTELMLSGRGIKLEVDNKISKQKTYRVTESAIGRLKTRYSIVQPCSSAENER